MKVKGLIFGASAVIALGLATPASALVFNVPGTSNNAGPFGSVFDTRSAGDEKNAGTAFNQALHTGYSDLSDARGGTFLHPIYDYPDSELFNHKARTAGRNASTLPDEPMDRDLSDADAAMFHEAIERLRDGFDRGGRIEAPGPAARAQVSYDCWIEAVEDGRGGDSERCKQAFEAAMADVESRSNYSLTELAYGAPEPAAPMATAAAMQPSNYMVYFEFDSSDLTAEGRAVLDAAIGAAQANPSAQVRMTAHADRSGRAPYNQALSEQRATSVISGLIIGGVDRGRITSEPVGETRPMVPTNDGVREPLNRVVEIDLL